MRCAAVVMNFGVEKRCNFLSKHTPLLFRKFSFCGMHCGGSFPRETRRVLDCLVDALCKDVVGVIMDFVVDPQWSRSSVSDIFSLSMFGFRGHFHDQKILQETRLSFNTGEFSKHWVSYICAFPRKTYCLMAMCLPGDVRRDVVVQSTNSLLARIKTHRRESDTGDILEMWRGMRDLVDLVDESLGLMLTRKTTLVDVHSLFSGNVRKIRLSEVYAKLKSL